MDISISCDLGGYFLGLLSTSKHAVGNKSSMHRRRLHGARGARAPNLRAQGPFIWLSPPKFCYTKFNFMYYFNKLTQLLLDLHIAIT